MISNSLIFHDKMWKIITYIDSIKDESTFRQIIEQMKPEEVTEEDISSVISFLKELHYGVRIKKCDNIKSVVPPKDKCTVSFELSFSQWIALQAHFPLLNKYSSKEFHITFAEKMSMIEAKHQKLDLFRVLEEGKQKKTTIENMNPRLSSIVKEIERSQELHISFTIHTRNGKTVSVFTHKIIYLDEHLSLIGEDTIDRCLVAISVKEIQNIVLNKHCEYNPNFSNTEIDDFIQAMRAISGKETRLVLKVSSCTKVNLNPPFHFQGSPYVACNTQGDLIWGASVEVDNNLFEWLYSIRDFVEILDPRTVREQFTEYCIKTTENEKISLKKAA